MFLFFLIIALLQTAKSAETKSGKTTLLY